MLEWADELSWMPRVLGELPFYGSFSDNSRSSGHQNSIYFVAGLIHLDHIPKALLDLNLKFSIGDRSEIELERYEDLARVV